ncbi:MAG: hypothetical protein R8M45_10720 [Ghiorsea sp.]
MATNPYFSQLGQNGGNINEQSLIHNLVAECIQIAGIDMFYLPKTAIVSDQILHEDRITEYTSSIPIEMYLESSDGFEGDAETLQAMGMLINDSATFQVATKRFKSALLGITNVPREGDLLYFAEAMSLFKITYVEDEVQFYPTGTLPSYKLKCEKFQYSGETMNTGILAVDRVQTAYYGDITDTTLPANPALDNAIIQTESDALLDFSEANPWGNS